MVYPLKKRLNRPFALLSSSDEEPSEQQNIDADPDFLALLGPDKPENQLRLKSVIVKPGIKMETQDIDNFPT